MSLVKLVVSDEYVHEFRGGGPPVRPGKAM